MGSITSSRIRIEVADADRRQEVYRLRHEVYSIELGQYALCSNGILPDSIGVESVYIIASIDDELVGFIGVTPPSSPCFSVENHLSSTDFPITRDKQSFEVRALTTKQPLRGSFVASSLMYAAFRWIEAHGGQRIFSIGRREVLDMYLRYGFKRRGKKFTSGAVTYELISAEMDTVSSNIQQLGSKLDRMEKRLDWNLSLPFHSPAQCYHGGAFFDAIGDQFDDMSRVSTIINADVLDAWFPPAPEAQEAIRAQLAWLMRTSPPTRCKGLETVIAETRGVDQHSILTGGGSSALIFLAFRYWLRRSSKVLILDPTYGEYTHVLEHIVQCKVERVQLNRSNSYQIDLHALSQKLAEGFDLFVWVNPNSPTGLHVAKDDVDAVLREASRCKRVWIDETYIEYAGKQESLESIAAQSENIIVCKSMSKVYALSGMRAAYLCASPHQLEPLRILTPPWSVGLLAQIAATYALQADDYYKIQYQQTHKLREDLIKGLRRLGIHEIIHGTTNFILFHLPEDGKDAPSLVKECQEHGLYIRDVSGMGSNMGSRAIRIAVKDKETNQRMLNILEDVLGQS